MIYDDSRVLNIKITIRALLKAYYAKAVKNVPKSLSAPHSTIRGPNQKQLISLFPEKVNKPAGC